MRLKLTYSSVYTCMWFMVAVMATGMNLAFVNGNKPHKVDTTELRINAKNKAIKNAYFKTNLHLVLPPLKPAATSNVKVSVSRPDDKLLNSVQLYPNTVTDQFNLKYSVSRNANVTVKIMDVLGNDITTVFSQRVDPGDHNLIYAVNNKLSRGFYFVRVVAGTESVIKRISVL